MLAGNLFGCEWGNMSWGHVTSRNLISWTKMLTQPALKPDQPYDQDGVFTGCFVQQSEPEDDRLVVCYSSVRKLPFHWSTPPYPRNAAGIAIATSTDGGKTWTKSAKNPILEGEPPEVRVTGFRDPYIAPWYALDQLRNTKGDHLYALVSGGIEGMGPTTFIYTMDRSDITHWEYLGPLVNLPQTFSPSGTCEANFGMNWECTNFMTLGEGSDERHFLIIGAEGDVERRHIAERELSSRSLTRTVRQQLWMCGDLNKKAEAIKFDYRYGGILDHGSYYAANSFHDPRLGKRIVHGWIPEEDCTTDFANAKGWNGSLALPREVFLLSIRNVVTALHTRVSELSFAEAKENERGSWDLLTLGVKPLEELKSLRERSKHVAKLENVLIVAEQRSTALAILGTPHWELEATVCFSPHCQTFALEISRLETASTRFKFEFSLEHETITIHRHHSGPSGAFNSCPEQGPFTLFAMQGSETEQGQPEELKLRIFVDGDIVEVFANDRFALATMVYSDYDSGSTTIVPSVTGTGGEATFVEMNVWDGLDSSTPFVAS